MRGRSTPEATGVLAIALGEANQDRFTFITDALKAL